MDVRNLVVDRRNRRRGLGRALLERAFAWCIERGMRGALLEVAEANTAASRLYDAYACTGQAGRSFVASRTAAKGVTVSRSRTGLPPRSRRARFDFSAT
ncbi:MAG: GNAT family N-acetyltransferase [Thermoleophilaceae bacterium]|nr:GNAT family N-acetyltransferase [Thermoleophilaceae bacterium]